ncbi:Gfo/Idh/MocA family oxidoreductase [Autumnicola edwardsiae]|uniref:Gfo/Idh/MocA family oxidoreductase n=1 Tax=Autumnicola edwardsiae TaxID=3075594 RepID=A0ABU3CTG5_9FLAO|nr:Gfo/Idh/MocA family oxidoreductase [Zunongwangia sp. F297]MDT0649650.1 Gfo/Idh/MocA family oxidoreductase [Zunongwangia sp. F297]
MAAKIRLGIIGMSQGNGHPYSWSAIFNGYNEKAMQNCPFPVIPEYLSAHNFPEDGLSHLGKVTHIWTQDIGLSHEVAEASNIEHVVTSLEDMIGHVDAILLARDDAASHYGMALPFLKAGLPIYIDKPIAVTLNEADKLLDAQQYEDQIFTCSSLRFASELMLDREQIDSLGDILHVEGSVPKYWDTYAVHLLEPIITQIPNRGELLNVFPFDKNGIRHVFVEWENTSAYIKVTGNAPSPLQIHYFGTKASVQNVFKDSFSCFRGSLKKFVEVVHEKSNNIPRQETLEIVRILEEGRL